MSEDCHCFVISSGMVIDSGQSVTKKADTNFVGVCFGLITGLITGGIQPPVF
jgi:hypothetical protein